MKNIKEYLINETECKYYVKFHNNWMKVKDDKNQLIFNKSFKSFDDCVKEIEQHAKNNGLKPTIILTQK